ncbi:MAG TPA: PAS domain S-box protein [Gemmatimonadales bacterium]|nr:PAS domain S-box protein [Gemmatimonadales bacterium]
MTPAEQSPEIIAVEETFRLLVDSIQDYAVFMIDTGGHVVTWNAGAERLKGYRADEVLGRHLAVFYPVEDQAKAGRMLQTAATAGRASDEGWRVRKDGSRFWAEAILTAIRDRDGRLLGFAKVTRDLTERRRAADELARTNAELETFSYSVSHDLRAPLRAMNGYAQALLEDHAAGLDAEGLRLLVVVRDNAQRLGEMIDALLTFSRLGRQALKVGPLDMTELARSVADELRHGAKDHTPDVRIDPLPAATGDRTLIRQVFANLLGNAFKFTRGRPSPRIEVGARSAGGDMVYLVRDNGAGFDMKYADKLFQVFSRLHHHDEFEGTGVGLALVQRIIQRHSGRIWAEGVLNQGATFYFTLPRESKSA